MSKVPGALQQSTYVISSNEVPPPQNRLTDVSSIITEQVVKYRNKVAAA